MVVSTIIKTSNKYGSFEHFQDIKYVKNNHPNLEVYDEYKKSYGNVEKEFISDREKFVFGIIDAPFHSMFDLFGNIINAININKNALFIIEGYFLKKAPKIFVEFFHIFLQNHNIEYVIVGENNSEILFKINNFSISKDKAHLPVPMPSNSIYKEFLYFVKNKEVKPSKKVYLSRKKYDFDKDNQYSAMKEMNLLGRINNLRIDDEEKLENFFKSLGFEIVYPEDFLTFLDQVEYFYQVKTLVGITGTGLMNCIFMQPNNNLIEIVTHHMIPQHSIFNKENNKRWGKYMLTQEHPYSVMANDKDHFYVAISNKTLIAEDLINKILNTEHLMNILS